MQIRLCKIISEVNILPIILAAGKGIRMKASVDKPKALEKYDGKPLIDYTIEPFIDMGLKVINYVLSYGAQAIMQHVSNNPRGYHKKTESVFTVIEDPENINNFSTLKCLAGDLSHDLQYSAYVIAPADIIGLTASLLIKMKNMLKHCDGVILTQPHDPNSSDNGYRRILSQGDTYLWSTNLTGIAKTAIRFNLLPEAIESITEVPTGIYLLKRKCLLESIGVMRSGDSLSDVFNYAVSLNYGLKVISLKKVTIRNINYKKDII